MGNDASHTRRMDTTIPCLNNESFAQALNVAALLGWAHREESGIACFVFKRVTLYDYDYIPAASAVDGGERMHNNTAYKSFNTADLNQPTVLVALSFSSFLLPSSSSSFHGRSMATKASTVSYSASLRAN